MSDSTSSIIGYPAHWNTNRAKQNPWQTQAPVRNRPLTANMVSTTSIPPSSSAIPGLSDEHYRQLMELLQPRANSISAFSGIDSSISPQIPWIIDTGASAHIAYTNYLSKAHGVLAHSQFLTLPTALVERGIEKKSKKKGRLKERKEMGKKKSFIGLEGKKDAYYCNCNDGLSDAIYQRNIDYACGAGADCSPIMKNGPCFQPNTVENHCNFAVNSYYQRCAQVQGSCSFSNTAAVVQDPPGKHRLTYKSRIIP
ncbi:unnamed protein product [Fraxinus pennsylvanica]|uniref:X8 domain-containing protein n=1 Tax=Fraxinus pennsylvanica TaxID=56036 RepID=A0AAD2A6H5_9LAMI|nr:unnamed protein product [Fraxinus pennsylvanica]